jgi:hypothetical protein
MEDREAMMTMKQTDWWTKSKRGYNEILLETG